MKFAVEKVLGLCKQYFHFPSGDTLQDQLVWVLHYLLLK